MPDRTDPAIIRSLRDYRLALIAREDNQIERLAGSWLRIENSLRDEMALLALQIKEARDNGQAITEQLLRRMSRYEQLDNQMKEQILRYAREEAVPDIEFEQLEYGNMALSAASDVISMQFALAPQFDRLAADHVETYVGLAGDGSPLYKLLKEAYPASLDGVIKSLFEGMARGLNPNQVAYNMSQAFGIGLERITLIARTEQLRVNRLVSADQYRASGLDGHMRRVATKDGAACMACLVSDGEIIPLDRTLDDHPRGRCVAIFQVKGSPVINWEKGPDWFERQPEELQREMMGDKKYGMWKDGQFELLQMRQTSHNDIWGDSPREATLQELLEGVSPNITQSIAEDIPLPIINEDFRNVSFGRVIGEFSPEGREILRDYTLGNESQARMIRTLLQEYDAATTLQDELRNTYREGIVRVYRGGSPSTGKYSNATLDFEKASLYASGFTGADIGQVIMYDVPIENFIGIGSSSEQEVFFRLLKKIKPIVIRR